MRMGFGKPPGRPGLDRRPGAAVAEAAPLAVGPPTFCADSPCAGPGAAVASPMSAGKRGKPQAGAVSMAAMRAHLETA